MAAATARCISSRQAIFSHQDFERRGGRAAGAGHVLAQLGGRLLRHAGKLAGTDHGRACEAIRQIFRQAGFDAGCGKAFDEQEHVGRAAAGNRGHRIEQPLIVDPGHLPHGLQQFLTDRALGDRHVRIRAGNRDAASDRGRRVRHGAHDGGARAQVTREAGDGLPGRDRQHRRAVLRKTPVLRRDLVQPLRLDGEDHHVGREAGRQGIRRRHHGNRCGV